MLLFSSHSKIEKNGGKTATLTCTSTPSHSQNSIPNFQCKMLAKAIKYCQTYTAHIIGVSAHYCAETAILRDNFVNHAELAFVPHPCAKTPICAKAQMIAVLRCVGYKKLAFRRLD